MIARVEVDVATARPVGDHATITIDVLVDDPDGTRSMWDMETEARLVAAQMSLARPAVVMPIRTTITDITDL